MEKFFVSRPIFAISLAIVIVLVGLISIMGLPIEQYPDITPPVVEVSATYDGADAETVNNAVATPVAQSVMGVSDMLYLQTTSANDGSMVMQVTFDIGSDPDLDAIFTQNNVSSATAQLPATVTKQGVTTRKTMTGFLLVFSLHSDGRYDAEFLSNYAYINLQNELLKIDGVGKVSIMGAGEYAMRVWLKPDVLKYYGIPVSAVTAAIENQGGIYPAGQFGAEPAPDGTTYTYTVTMPPQITTPAQFGDIVVVTTSEGQQIRLCDVAEVSLGSQSYGVSSLFEGKPTAMIVVYQQPGSNAVEVGKKVRAAMARLEKRMPDGIAATTIVDTTTSIDAGIRDIFHTLVIALILVIFIIYLFIQDWRATVIPLVAIPVSLIGAFALFPLLGFSVNIISLLGLVLAVPAIFHASEAGPGSMHAPAIVALLIALVVGALAQKSRLCMVGGIRDSILVKDNHLLYGFIAIFLTVLIGNLVQGSFKLGFDLQPIAHSSHLWNLLGMVLVGWGSVLLGGCPLRQLILAGSGNGDSAVTVFGMIVGAAFAHNFALAGNPDSTNDAGELVVGGIANAGKVAVAIGFVVLLAISLLNSRKEATKA